MNGFMSRNPSTLRIKPDDQINQSLPSVISEDEDTHI